MTAVPVLPPARAEALLGAYARAVARRRRASLAAAVALLLLVLLAARMGEVDLGNLFGHLASLTSYFGRILPPLHTASLGHDVAEWYWDLGGWLKLLLDTVLIAFLATLGGAIGALLVAPFAAANLAPSPSLRWLAKRWLEFCRTVPDLVFALLFVAAFGLGPLAGVLAIAIHSFGALGKLFTEVLENIDMRPVEGVRSTGGGFPAVVRFAALPQVMPNLASYTLLRFEINVRASSIVGLVGAGGIGQDLFVAIRKFYYTDVSAILLLLIVTVSLIDLATERVRDRLAAQQFSLAAPLLLLPLAGLAWWWLDIAVDQIGTGLATLGKYLALMVPPSTGGHLPLLLHALGETLAIALLGTLVAAVIAFPLGFLAARNTTPAAPLRFLVRRSLDTIRGIDALIWALVFVSAVGLGPFAGVLAIAVSDTGALGKLFSEAIEAAEERQRESVLACGGGSRLAVRFGLMPQLLPVLAGQVLYFFESNTRSATIIGIVGAGGIGLHLAELIRTFDFDQMAFVVLMILAIVGLIDWLSGRLRFAVIGIVPAAESR